jgi:16S rRNA (cytosine1402-N4)-methyltransferase
MESSSTGSHIPVMRDRAVELLGCRSGGRYVDGTLGGGGYAEAILRASAPDGVVLGLDWDAEALARVREKLQGYGERLHLAKSSYADLTGVLEAESWERVDGIVLDLGVSSFQLDDSERGFSFMHDGPLDMRMNLDLPRTAADLVNDLPEKELSRLIAQLGEERWARRIAGAIAEHRKTVPFSRTRQLSQLIREVVPMTKDARRIHPATRTFQALRLAVNQELEALDRFLSIALNVLEPEGRLVIVAFHSLEDRIVKRKFREWSKSCRCPHNVVICQCEGRPMARLLTRKAMRPDLEETEINPRSRSARLRAVEKC